MGIKKRENEEMENLINKKIERKIISLLRQHGIKKASIFGSFARGETTKDSDIDILIEFKKNKSLLDLARLELALERALKRSVDVLTYLSVHPLLKKSIMGEEVRII